MPPRWKASCRFREEAKENQRCPERPGFRWQVAVTDGWNLLFGSPAEDRQPEQIADDHFIIDDGEMGPSLIF